MTPLYEKFARGGWLFDNKGSVYTNGDSPFYGSFNSLLTLGEIVLCAAMRGNTSYAIITNKGNLLTAGESRSVIPAFESKNENDNEYVCGAIAGDNIAFYDGVSTIYLRKISLIEKQNFSGKTFEINLKNGQQVQEILFTSSGSGVYVLTNTGFIITCGDAAHYGDFSSEDITANAMSMALKPWGEGYWVIDKIGGVFCFGDADYFGSIPGDGMNIDAIKIKAHSSGRGYWIVDKCGNIFPFGYADVIENKSETLFSDINHFVPEEIINDTLSLKGAKGIIGFLFDNIKANNDTSEKTEIL